MKRLFVVVFSLHKCVIWYKEYITSIHRNKYMNIKLSYLTKGLLVVVFCLHKCVIWYNVVTCSRFERSRKCCQLLLVNEMFK